tara:strand:+ start:3861 stop:4739 length:879 start_codon:yes stop_codon:yes gene_type:complete
MMINNPLFYCKNKDNYPPFKNGLYMEEYFLNYVTNNNIQTKRKYIPALWTNFQIEHWFTSKRNELQLALDDWVRRNPSEHGYFTITQYDDGPLLKLPDNTLKFGACSGDVPLPLIYQDVNNTLESISKKTFHEKPILCSFVGNITSNNLSPNVRQVMFSHLTGKSNFKMINSGGWTPIVNQNLQQLFIETTINSKFALAPRGYGRSSFRFFECFQLGTIPIYIWNDINWLPFQDVIDYEKLCIVIHVSEIQKLNEMLLSIDETKYNNMFTYYHTVKYLFQLDGMTKHVVQII